MKFAAIVSATAIAAVTNADVCDVKSLQSLLTSPETNACATDSGYEVTSLATPTDEQMNVMCSNSACAKLLSTIKTLAPDECTLGNFDLYADLIDPLVAYCSSHSSGDGSPTTSSVSEGPDSKTKPSKDMESESDLKTPTASEVTGSESKTPTASEVTGSASKTPTASEVSGSASKTPTTSNDHSYTFTSDTSDDTSVHQSKTPTPDAKKDTTVEQAAPSPDDSDDTSAKQTTSPASKGEDDTSAELTTSPASKTEDDTSAEQTTSPATKAEDNTSAETTSSATSASIAAVSAGVFAFTVAIAIL